MCGLTGCLSAPEHTRDEMHAILSAMAASLTHRGPDDAGTWIDPPAGVALGHRRLSILDVSEAGHQPMVSPRGRYVLVYNGEMYNAPALRPELESLGIAFRGHSDTEVLLAGVEAWGLEGILERARGMFALAVWDREERFLRLARDRIGIKPLYYGWHGGTFLFGSELKSLRAHPAFHAEVDRDVLALYFRHTCVPAPYAIFKHTYKLPPGCILTVRGASMPEGFSAWPSADADGCHAPKPFWETRRVVEAGLATPTRGSYGEALATLEGVLLDAVGARLLSDVPLGAFLSGGVDSSLIVALMTRLSARPVRTFTIGFDDPRYNEAEHAAAVAAHLGTDHTDMRVTPADALALIPTLPTVYDEPFADASQIPTCLLARLTRGHVTVCLSGDGGDEVFAGYHRYAHAMRIWNRIHVLPHGVRRGLAWMMGQGGRLPGVDALGSLVSAAIPGDWTSRPLSQTLGKTGVVVGAASPQAFYHALMSQWRDPTALVPGASEPMTHLTDPRLQVDDHGDFIRRMMYMDLMQYFPDDILVKVDRASMAVGLEVRVPFADPHVVSYASTLPTAMLVRGGQGKRILRDLLSRYVPAALMERPKRGFAVPIGGWLRGELREWAEGLLGEGALRDAGELDAGVVSGAWREHLTGRRDWAHPLWAVLMYLAWRKTWG